jgi:hypothetical protein
MSLAMLVIANFRWVEVFEPELIFSFKEKFFSQYGLILHANDLEWETLQNQEMPSKTREPISDFSS